MGTTYMFGAGASANALPVVNNLSLRIGILSGAIVQLYGLKTLSDVEQSKINALIKDFDWLQNICHPKNNYSIDTYAKILYLRNSMGELRRLKYIFALYFALEHIYSNLDLRYDSFWASILETPNNNPYPTKGINIISWNYDLQLEKSYLKFTRSGTIENLPILARPNHTAYPNEKNFKIIKLNGTIAKYSRNSPFQHILKDCLELDFTKESIEKYIEHRNDFLNNQNLQSSICFAWEEEYNNTEIFSKAQEIIKESECIVIIGYSFPYYNRTIDRKILNCFQANTLKNIYIQAPEKDCDKIKQRLIATFINIKESNIQLVTDTDQFFIPPEL